MGNEQSFLTALTNRRAVKRFGGEEILEGDRDTIMEAIVSAPSSFGIQPYKVCAVRNKELKEKLRAVSYGQPQVTECDILFVFCARTDVKERADEYLKATGAEAYREMMMGFLSGQSDATAWAARQAYIALGFALTAAAVADVPSCPMEGFVPSEVAKLLELPETLVPVCYLAVGSEAEGVEPPPRFRFPKDDLFKEYT